jgi:glycosyltransferase involved in cell wall biosynthesis
LACGRPVVISKGIGDLEHFLSEFKAGVVIDVENDNLIEKAEELIDVLLDSETPNQCRSLAERYFDIDKGLVKYLDVYNSILNN